MRKFANSNKVNYGIGLALLGILVFSLMVPVEGMTTSAKKAPEATSTVKKASAKIANVEAMKEGIQKKTSGNV